jgi:hypothetical protein
VIVVGALSAGLDGAQDEVLARLTGVGTDLWVSCPIAVSDGGGTSRGAAGAFGELSAGEQAALERKKRQNGLDFDLANLGDPGERYSESGLLATELSFPTSEAAKIGRLDGVEGAAASLTVNAVTLKGAVAESSRSRTMAIHGGQSEVTPQAGITTSASTLTSATAACRSAPGSCGTKPSDDDCGISLIASIPSTPSFVSRRERPDVRSRLYSWSLVLQRAISPGPARSWSRALRPGMRLYSVARQPRHHVEFAESAVAKLPRAERSIGTGVTGAQRPRRRSGPLARGRDPGLESFKDERQALCVEERGRFMSWK